MGSFLSLLLFNLSVNALLELIKRKKKSDIVSMLMPISNLLWKRSVVLSLTLLRSLSYVILDLVQFLVQCGRINKKQLHSTECRAISGILLKMREEFYIFSECC